MPTVVWSIVLRAAARMISVFAACRDLANAPSQQAVFDALEAGLPRTLPVLEKRLNRALTTSWPRRLQRRRWQVAIDWHLIPYYGEPRKSRNEIYRSKQRQGTTHFHAYATACIVQYGQRYTVALTWIRRHESTVTVLRRLLASIREIRVKKSRFCCWTASSFTAAVMAFLQKEELAFLMPVMFRGRRPKNRKTPKKGLRWLKRQKAGWHRHTLKNGKDTLTISVCVAYRSYYNRKKRKRGQQKLLFAAWRGMCKGTQTWRRRSRLPQTLWHRIQLPPTAAGAALYLHARPPLAARVRGRSLALAESVGVDSRDDVGRRTRRDHDPPPRTVALQAAARLDRSSCRSHTP